MGALNLFYSLKLRITVIMLYHVSQKSGLKILTPHISTHKKAYVYALENMVTAILFGVKKDDFDFLIYSDENNTPILYECYPDALKKIYQGEVCSLYEVNGGSFLRSMTEWSDELVSESEVEVIKETVIEDIYKRLLEEEQSGKLIIHRYEYNNEYRKTIANHIVDRIFRFEIDLDKCREQDERFAVYFNDLVEKLLDVMDGHLLK